MASPSKTAPACLHVIDTGGPGGAETVFSQLASRLNSDRMRSIAVVPREGWLSGQLRTLGLEPRIISARGSINVGYLQNLARLARAENVRIVHAHLLGSCVYAAMLGRWLRLPVVGVLHGPTDFRTPGRFANAKRWLIKQGISQIVAVSGGTRDALNEFGIGNERIELIPNGVDTGLYRPDASTELRQELGLAPGDLLVGSVGNIRAPKAYDVLLQAAARVLANQPRAHFAVVGEGSERDMQPLLRLRDSLGIASRFHFLGFRKTTAALYTNFDLFVSSSRSEGLPLSFLEAMACGLCIVATESGGPQEVIEQERTGLSVPIENPPALAAAIERVLGDDELRRRLGATAREKVSREFSLDATVERYRRIYTRLLGARS